ncbi:MAG: hypothetical protein U1F52_11645 [Burkholderiales bacterium]
MCFEFEWLYWAQLAQEQEQQRRQTSRQTPGNERAPTPQEARQPQPLPQEPAHV